MICVSKLRTTVCDVWYDLQGGECRTKGGVWECQLNKEVHLVPVLLKRYILAAKDLVGVATASSPDLPQHCQRWH